MGVVGWGLWGLGELCKEVAEGWARRRDCDGGLGPRKRGWLQRPSLLRV